MLNFVVYAVLAILTLGYYYVRRQFSYWKVRGVNYVEPTFPMGNFGGVATKRTMGQIWQNAYNELKNKGKGSFGGVFFLTDPSVLTLDLDFLRNVFVKDFQHFQDRGFYVNEKDDPLSAHLFNIGGSKWKALRGKLSPTFTSGKMKMMHPTMVMVANQFREHLMELSSNGKTELELKDLLAQFTTDMIGNTAFGIECNSMKNPNNEFRTNGRKSIESSPLQLLQMMFVLNFPKIAEKLRMKFTIGGVTEFFLNLCSETIKYREENKVKRNDFMSLLIQLKNDGKLEGDNEYLGKITFEEVAAQLFLFFAAGFETSSSTMTFALYELAMHPGIQERARGEVEEVLERHGGEMTYEAAMELNYLDQIIQETLRKHPIVEFLFRKVTIPYKTPSPSGDGDILLEKGTRVIIPVLGIHRDPEIYPEPETFDPERFTKENIAARHPYAWMPFGLGPRNCVGMRFGMMQTRLGLAMILKNFFVTPSKKTAREIVLDPSAFLMSPKGGMFLNIERVK